jgi:group I intron endonuclease
MEKMTTGIYCIENIENNHKYIGKSHTIEKRWREHVWCLNAQTHDNSYFQRAWNKYGERSFRFYVVEVCEVNDLCNKEKYYIKNWKTKRPNGYNLTDGGDATEGYRHTQKLKDFVSQLNSGRKHTLEQRLKMIETRRLIFNETGKGTRSGSKNVKTASKYFGVSWNKTEMRWKVEFYLDRKNKFLGYFDKEIKAARCYDKYVIENNLDKPINFPNSKEISLSMDFSKKSERRKRGTRQNKS